MYDEENNFTSALLDHFEKLQEMKAKNKKAPPGPALQNKIRNIYNLTNSQKEKMRREGMFKQLSIPFPENYRDKKSQV